ncbi:MAG: hypothetical protein LBQ31_04825 [Bacteroidales bacterium]|nr:hypothetical protein [Bacteroidales bacterium]
MGVPPPLAGSVRGRAVRCNLFCRPAEPPRCKKGFPLPSLTQQSAKQLSIVNCQLSIR